MAAAAIEGIESELAVDMLRQFVAAQAARRPGEGQRGAGAAFRRPSRMNGRQEIEIGLVVDLGGGGQAMIVGREHRAELDLAQARKDEFGAGRHFIGGHDGAGDELEIARMAVVAWRIDSFHGGTPGFKKDRPTERGAV